MNRFMLLAGAAALAVSSGAASAQQGKGQQGKSNNGAKAQNSGKAQAGKGAKRNEIRVARQSNDKRGMARVKGNDRAKMDRGNGKLARVDRNDRNDRPKSAEWKRDNDKGREVRDVRDLRDIRSDRNWDYAAVSGSVWANGGCPPGLAKKPVACMPPGQAKALTGQRFSALNKQANLREIPLALRSLYRDNDDYYYRYGNGYVYQVDRNRDVISSLLPLFGLGATVGQQFPASYGNSFMPTALRSFYPNSGDASYRYANGYVYKVNPYTGTIQDIDPMLGYGYGYGQMMPASYSAYNVPSQYRSLYADNNDHYYRYAPGSIYRVDAGSGLIDSVAALLMPGGMSVGQALPMGYSAYNVPTQYRSQYYDTPESMYRYSNGYIYQADPTTRLVTAIISALV